MWRCQGKEYTVTRQDGTAVTRDDPIITTFRGEDRIFESVSRGPEYNGTAKVMARELGDPQAWESYAGVFGLTVTPV